LIANLKESDPTGFVVFQNGLNLTYEPMLVYDLDLGENSFFNLNINSKQIVNSNDKLQIEKYFKIIKNSNEITNNNLNILNYNKIDFDTIDSPSIINTTTGIGFKIIEFNIEALQIGNDYQLYSTNSIPVILKLQDSNDNEPLFSQDTYYASFDYNSIINTNVQFETLTLNSNLKVVSFSVQDKDVGIYGLDGLKCFLLGEDSEK
jgi:hypothetical protein